MGGSHSNPTSNVEYDNTIVNKSDINVLNESVNKFVTNTIVKQAQNCSANITQLQEIDLSRLHVAGDFNFEGADQNQSSVITFGCVNLQKFQNNIATGILSEYATTLDSNFSTDAETQISATAEANAKNGLANFGSADANPHTDVKYRFNNETITNKNIRNLVQNTINNNLNMETVQKCVSKVIANQYITFAGSEFGGNVHIGPIKQTQASNIMLKCIQEGNSANNITNDIRSNLGIQVDEENGVHTRTRLDSHSKGDAENEGLGGLIKNMFDGLSGFFSGILGKFFSWPVIIACIVITLIVIVGGYFFLNSEGGKMVITEASKKM